MAALGAAVDVFHALLMVVQLGGVPLLFWHRWPRLTKAYAIYAVVFVITSEVSQRTLGECFLTTIARKLWQRGGGMGAEGWFTVRFAKSVFGVSPSNDAIIVASEILLVIVAVGVMYTLHAKRARARSLATLGPSSHQRAGA